MLIIIIIIIIVDGLTLESKLGENQESSVCGEDVTVVCNANYTTFITISVDGYGFHTFERNSKKLTQLGPFNLNLTKADTDPHNYFLTTFEVVGITNQQYVVDLQQITCSDVKSSDFLKINIESKFILGQSVSLIFYGISIHVHVNMR